MSKHNSMQKSSETFRAKFAKSRHYRTKRFSIMSRLCILRNFSIAVLTCCLLFLSVLWLITDGQFFSANSFPFSNAYPFCRYLSLLPILRVFAKALFFGWFFIVLRGGGWSVLDCVPFPSLFCVRRSYTVSGWVHTYCKFTYIIFVC